MTRLASMIAASISGFGPVLSLLVIVMMIAQAGLVVLRHVFGINAIGAQESVIYLHAVVIMVGAALVLQQGRHIRLDLVSSGLSPAARRWVDLIGHWVFLIPLCLVVLWCSLPWAINSWRVLEGALSVGGLPAVFLLKSLVPLFAFLLLLQSLACILDVILSPRPDDQP